MSTRERVAILRGVRELAGCDDAELSALAHFMDEARVPAGTVLAQGGGLCHELVIVAGGMLEACRRGKVVSLGPGETVGWEAMRNRGRHDATVRTTSPAHLLAMSHEQFRAVAALALTPENPHPKRRHLFRALPSSRRPLPQPARLAASVGQENRCSNPGC